MKLTVKQLRSLVRGVIAEQNTVAPYGRNYQTLDDNPISWQSYPGITIDQWPETDRGYYIKIHVDQDDSLSTPGRIFSTEEDAMSYARRHVEEIKRYLMNQTSVPADSINLATIDSEDFPEDY